MSTNNQNNKEEEIALQEPKKKGFDTNSNAYTIIYATVMVVLVALILSYASQALHPIQKLNEDNDKRQQILRSIHVEVSASEAEETFNKLITESFFVNEQGEKVEGDAFAEEVEKAFEKKTFPVFIATVDGEEKYILAMRGAGLWGPLWGFLSLNKDRNTIYGADFSHASETPGLGAEIVRKDFSSQLKGKELFKQGVFKSVAVVKPGKKAEGKDYIDGISGGTITSQGVDAMIAVSIMQYTNFLTSDNQ